MSFDLFIQNNDNLLPRGDVRIVQVVAQPSPEGRRVRVGVEITPFREQPNLEIAILSADGRAVASTSVIALMHFKVEFNLHLRGVDDSAGDYIVRVQLYYEDAAEPQDTREAALHIPTATGDSPRNSES
ncbi:MAG: hypothetical protein GXY36_11250 [Chloroflexi bacterium]|nr:hypothetical protein [Chloroflexota bacterium]